MNKWVKPFKPTAFAHLVARDHATWTHYDSSHFLIISILLASRPY